MQTAKPRYQMRTIKYAFGNKPNEAEIQRIANQMYAQGYQLTTRTEKTPGCLGAISSSIFGGGRTALTFELREGV